MSTTQLLVNDDGVWLRGAQPLPDDVFSVHFDGRRIWSPRNATWERRGDGVAARWPAHLRERLSGATRVSVESAGRVVAEAAARFGDSAEPLELVDPLGRGLSVDKWDRLQPVFDGRGDDFAARLMDATERVLGFLQDVVGLDPFIISGTLLGAVRDGRLIAHDDNVDLAYLSRCDNPSDVALERDRIERALRAGGFDPIALSAAHLQITFWRDGYKDFYVDLFTHFVTGGHYCGPFYIRVPADRIRIHPLAAYEIEGHSLPGPADAEAFLTANYGPQWRTPDPSFRFDTPRQAGDRFFGWFGDYNVGREDWDNYYQTSPQIPPVSSFAKSVESWIAPGAPVIDLGFGSGQDSRYFAEHGHHVEAIDFAHTAVLLGRQALADVDVHVQNLNLTRLTDVAAAIRPLLAAGHAPQVYARRLLDSMHAGGHDTVWWTLRALLAGGGDAWIEFRPEDCRRLPGEPTHIPPSPDAVVAGATRHGLTVRSRRSLTGDDGEPVVRLHLVREKGQE